MYFYPRSPCGERHGKLLPAGILRRYFYPRSPCGERRLHRFDLSGLWDISIHALLAESDGQGPPHHRHGFQFLSTLSLRRATLPICKYGLPLIFLSTLSLRRATSPSRKTGRLLPFLSTLSLRRATIFCPPLPYQSADFYPRSPCGERRPPAPPRREF